jgi:hypothetical protein
LCVVEKWADFSLLMQPSSEQHHPPYWLLLTQECIRRALPTAPVYLRAPAARCEQLAEAALEE